MIEQTLFLVGLYVVGVLIGLTLKRSLPVPFICLSGFLWGSLLWVVAAVCCLILSIPYSAPNMKILMASIVILVGIAHIRRGTWRLSAGDIVWMAVSTSAFLVVAGIAVRINHSMATHDSAMQIMLGRAIAYDGFVKWPQAGIVSYGAFLPLLHSASVFLGQDYLWAVHPVFAASLFAVFCYCCDRAVRQSFPSARIGLTLALLATLALFSTALFVIQVFYIQSSLVAAAYLFVAVGSGWLALREGNSVWLIVTVTALTGFCLSRLESSLFAVAFLSFLVSTGRLSYRIRVWAILPFVCLMLLWYQKLLRLAYVYPSDIFRPKDALITIVVLGVFGIFIVLSRFRFLEYFILPRLHIGVVATLLATLVFLFVQKPEHMLTNVTNTLKNMTYYGSWGPTWVILLVLVAFAAAQSRIPHERLVSFFILTFFMLLLAVGGMRVPYRLGYGDSANRMLTHIAPIIFFYVLLKYGYGLASYAADERESGKLAAGLAITGGVLLIVSLLLFGQLE